MALLQALISFLSRSLGKIFSALFDWAVVALFGRVGGTRKTALSVLMAAAAAWPLLLAGVVAPKVAAVALAFVPLPHAVPANVVRLIWIALALIVPLGVGVAVRAQGGPARRPESALRSVLRGFPITLGLAAAFAVLLVTVPVLRIVSGLRGRRDVHVPLVTTPESYPVAASLVLGTLRRHGIDIVPAPPPWWMALPSRILLRLGRGAFEGYVLEKIAYFRNAALEAALYPNALLLRGRDADTARAHALTVEAVTGHPDMFQTFSAEAQDLERQIQRVWTALRRQPEAHVEAGPLLSRLDDIAAQMARLPLPFEEWQIIYRQVLQLERALRGERQLLEATLPRATPPRPAPPRVAWAGNPRALSTRQLLGRIAEAGSLLVQKEVALAREELKADIRAELASARLLAGAFVGALIGVTCVLLAGVFVLAWWMPAWIAALVVGGLVLGVSVALGLLGWGRLVLAPLAVTRKTVTEDLQWAKERLA
jgi:Putative Actinobacterial Holin-X, holin superfamily III